MSKLKAVVIGVGASQNSHGRKGGGHQIGYTHATALRRNRDCELAAGVDINAENLAAFRKTFEVPAGFADVGEMLTAVRPDVVTIGTYVGLHRRFVEQCARAGVKAILCEKPFLNSPADVAPVRAVAAETGVKIVVAHIRRHRAAFVRARELVRIGAIGTPQRLLSSLGGWDLSEMGSHWFDLIRFFNGDNPVKWVMGQARVREARGYGHVLEEVAVAHFAFENGVRGVLEAGEGMNGDANFGFVLVGSAGVIRIRGENVLTLETLTGSRVEDFVGHPAVGWEALGLELTADDGLSMWDVMVSELVRWVRGGPPAQSHLESALATLEINQAAYVSALRGDRVDLPMSADDVTEYPVDVMAKRAGKN